MEGWLLKRHWLGSWKMRYLRCTSEEIQIFKTKEDQAPSYSAPLINIDAFAIPKYRKKGKFAFKIVDGTEDMIFASESLDEFNKWIDFLSKGGRRVSAISRKSRLSSFSSASVDLDVPIAFDFDNYIACIDRLTQQNHKGMSSILQLSSICASFLSTVRQHFQDSISDDSPKELPGVIITPLNAQQRVQAEQKIASSVIVAEQQIQGVYVPLMAIVDDRLGRSFFVETVPKLSKKVLSESVKSKLSSLSLQLGVPYDELQSSDWVVDPKGRLFVRFNLPPDPASAFASELERCETFAVDPVSLAFELRRRKITIYGLPSIIKSIKNPQVRAFLYDYLIGFACASFRKSMPLSQFLNQFLSEKACVDEISKWFEKIFQTALPPIDEWFSKAQLLKSLEFHLGFSTQKEPPFSESDLSICDVIHSDSLFELCCAFLENEDMDPFFLMLSELHDKAIQTLSDYLLIAQSIFGEQSPEASNLLVLMSLSYCVLNEPAYAQMCLTSIQPDVGFRTVADIFLSSFNESKVVKSIDSLGLTDGHPIKAIIPLFVARIQLSSGNAADAEKCLKIFEDCLQSKDHPLYGYFFLFKNGLLLSKGDVSEAMQLAQKSLQIFQEFYSIHSVQASLAFFQIAECHYAAGNYQAALEYAGKSYSIWDEYPKERQTYQCIQQLACIYDRLDDSENAFAFYQAILDFLKMRRSSDALVSATQRNIVRVFFRKLFRDDPFMSRAISSSSPRDAAEVKVGEVGKPAEALKKLADCCKAGGCQGDSWRELIGFYFSLADQRVAPNVN